MKWSESEIQIAQQMKQAGHLYSEIADRLGRTMWSVRAYILRGRDAERRRARRQGQATAGDFYECPIDPVIAERLLDERDRREAAPYRSLAHEFFGDPPIGYAALDKHA